MKLTTVVEYSIADVVQSNSRKEIQDFICELDLQIAELSFTENLIIRLIKSIKSDLSPEEWEPYQKLLEAIEPSV